MQHKLICFDGGGIRGLVPLLALQRLEAAHPGLIARSTLLAGTSTGGIIALCLAAGVPVADIIALYRDKGPTIFSRSIIDRFEDAGGLSGALYDPKPLQGLLDGILGNVLMCDLPKPVLVPTFELDNRCSDPRKRRWGARFWTRMDHILAQDVAMMTSAAPTFFPSHMGCIDGGTVSNNPAAVALSMCRGESALLLSLGTGITLEYVTGQTLDFGDLQWLQHNVTSTFLVGGENAAEFICQQLLGSSYRRLNPSLQPGQNIAMDDVAAIPTLMSFGATADLADVPQWLVQSGW